MEQRVEETVRARLPDIEGHEDMTIKVRRGHFTSSLLIMLQFFILNLQKLCTIQLSAVDNYSFHLLRRLNSGKKNTLKSYKRLECGVK